LLHVRIFTSNIFLNKPRHNNCVPLHRPYLGSMFRNNIKDTSIFTFKICGGILPWAIEFKNSCWYGSVDICFFLPYLSIFNPPVLFPLLFCFFLFYIVITNYDTTPRLWNTYTPHIRCVWTRVASASINIITPNYVIFSNYQRYWHVSIRVVSGVGVRIHTS